MMGENNKLLELPKEWVLTELGQIGDIVSGGTPSTGDLSNFDGDIVWITPADLSGYTNKFISKGKRNITKKGLKASSATLIPKGSILFSSRAPIGYVAIGATDFTTNQGFKSLVPHSGIFNEYVYYYLKASKNIAEALASGTTFLEISKSKFAKIPIPIPPLSEQHRIVAKIEELFTQLDAGVAALERTRTLLRRYRQTVLKAAVTGELTREWREAHQGEIEPAETKVDVFIGIEQKDLFNLPKDWYWATWAQLSEDVTVGFVGTMKKEYIDQGVPFLRSQNVRENYYDPQGLVYISENFHKKLKKSTLKPGDLVVTRSGSVGVTCVIPESLTEANCSDLVIIHKPKLIIPKFGGYYMNSLARRFVRLGQVGIALPHFNTKSVARLPVPIPSLKEQVVIVTEVEQQLSVIDEIEAEINLNLRMADRLRQSILQQAFSGRLVSQDPHDEPASNLIRQIQEQHRHLMQSAHR